MSGIGGNNPPDMTVTAGEVANDLSAWMAEHPIVANEAEAREAKVFIDRAKLGIKDLEDERTNRVRPLNEEVKKINGYYKGPKEILESCLSALEAKVRGFLAETERKRVVAAREAARIAEDAERVARDADAAVQDAIGSVDSGELGVDVKAAVVGAQRAYDEYGRAARAAALAERETKVKIGGGFTRALGLREKETLQVTDWYSAIVSMYGEDTGGPNVSENLREAIIKDARGYRKLYDKLPDGISSQKERTL
jgi:hypothetical protein